MKMNEERIHIKSESDGALPGSMNDDQVIRSIVTAAIKSCKRSRAQIAEQMSYLVGDKVTERMLSSWTSEAMERHRFPLHFSRAFCRATGNWRLVQCVAEMSGFTVIGQEEVEILELGRSYLDRKAAEENMSALERSILQRSKE
jgi:hypothetical protein